MSITVVVPTFNRLPLLDDALASLARQSYRDFDVIVVNDGGASVGAVLDRWRGGLDVKLLDLATNIGISRARNVAIDIADGEHIAFLDDDDVFLPHHLARAHEMLATCDAACFGAYVSNRRRAELPADLRGATCKRYAFDPRFLLVCNYIHTGALVVRNFRDTSIRFDPSFEVCEDWDLWVALSRRLGYRFCSSSELTTIYHQVPGLFGLCSEAERQAPTPFSIARDLMYAKWPDQDPLVLAHRAWMSDFEELRNARISAGAAMPANLFDSVLQYLYVEFQRGRAPDPSIVPSLVLDGTGAERTPACGLTWFGRGPQQAAAP
jgi:glycosyltransferase involved in cell wall biosynthesis